MYDNNFAKEHRHAPVYASTSHRGHGRARDQLAAASVSLQSLQESEKKDSCFQENTRLEVVVCATMTLISYDINKSGVYLELSRESELCHLKVCWVISKQGFLAFLLEHSLSLPPELTDIIT